MSSAATDGPSAFSPPSIGILAGGEGARFGGLDKPWISLKGKALVEWTLEGARDQASELLVSANRNLDRYAAMGIVAVADDPGSGFQGPLAGITRLLEAASGPWLMCLPCDLVLVPADLARRFHACAAEHRADIVVYADQSGIHPTICYLQCSLATDARACLDAGERAPRRWFERHRVSRLVGTPPLNINSPARLAELEERLELGV